MDAEVALQRKKTIKFFCIVDFPLSKQGIFFITLRQKTLEHTFRCFFFFLRISACVGTQLPLPLFRPPKPKE